MDRRPIEQANRLNLRILFGWRSGLDVQPRPVREPRRSKLGPRPKEGPPQGGKTWATERVERNVWLRKLYSGPKANAHPSRPRRRCPMPPNPFAAMPPTSRLEFQAMVKHVNLRISHGRLRSRARIFLNPNPDLEQGPRISHRTSVR